MVSKQNSYSVFCVYDEYNVLVEASMYDADGREITDNFRNQEDSGNQVEANIGKAELFLLYVFIAIVMALGIIFTRYFLTE